MLEILRERILSVSRRVRTLLLQGVWTKGSALSFATATIISGT